ncbi:hypothetical protein, partial [Cronobacter sakazakii]|uniref:hypothetical protein n=1 Tax=Cronobacter sakazakii TaxID=28141 RepID=UPI001F6010A5
IDPNAWVERWKAAGLYNTEHRCLACDAQTTRDGVEIVAQHAYFVKGVADGPAILSRWRMVVDSQGALRCDIDIARSTALPPLPRVGVVCQLRGSGGSAVLRAMSISQRSAPWLSTTMRQRLRIAGPSATPFTKYACCATISTPSRVVCASQARQRCSVVYSPAAFQRST